MIYLLAIVAGVLAGIINTLAGSGSLVTLPLLIFMGLPANVANGTNRVGVLFQNIVGITTFRRGGALPIDKQLVWLLAPSIAGAVVGALIAVDLNERVLNLSIGVVMVIMLFVILSNPKSWLRERSEAIDKRPSALTLTIFFLLGIYAGFIQAGVGVFLLSALVLGAGYNLKGANAIKLIVVLVATVAAIPVFMANGQINWGIGLVLAAGQSLGAWLAARFATRYENANLWVRRLLIAVVVVSIVRLFGIWDLLVSLVT